MPDFFGSGLDRRSRGCYTSPMATTTSAKDRRTAERAARAAADPWFGKRRKTGMEGDRRKEASRKACRGRVVA